MKSQAESVSLGSRLVFKQRHCDLMLFATSLQLLPDWVEWLHTSLSAANPLLHSISIYGVKSTHMYKYIGHTLKPQAFFAGVLIFSQPIVHLKGRRLL